MKDTMSLEEYKAKLDAGVYDYQYKADYEEMVEQYSEVFKLWGQAQATADRRLELMRKQDKKIKVCQFCYNRVHSEDCEWGKELDDANS
jgi:hypothetical protein